MSAEHSGEASKAKPRDEARILPFESRPERKFRRALLLYRIAEQLGEGAPKGTLYELEQLVKELERSADKRLRLRARAR